MLSWTQTIVGRFRYVVRSRVMSWSSLSFATIRTLSFELRRSHFAVLLSYRQHPVDRSLGSHSNRFGDIDDVAVVTQCVQSVFQRNLVHMSTADATEP